jgi:hypothetical protein
MERRSFMQFLFYLPFLFNCTVSDITDQTYPNRLDTTYPNDTDQSITKE